MTPAEREEIEKDLTHTRWTVRFATAKLIHFEPSYFQMERGLTDPDPIIRGYWICRTSFVVDAKQMDRALTDSDASVRRSAALRLDYDFSFEQIERGLTDSSGAVRFQFSIQNYPFTLEQIERGLCDIDPEIRGAFATHEKYTPTPEQIERRLTDETEEVKQDFLSRTDFTLTPEQIDRSVKNCESEDTMIAYISRNDFILTPTLVEKLLNFNSFEITAALIQHVDFCPTKEQYETLQQETDEEFQFIIERRENEWLSKIQTKELKAQFKVDNLTSKRKTL
jgi:hypothetical protein